MENLIGSAINNLGCYMLVWWILIAGSLSWLAVLIDRQERRQSNIHS